MFITIQKRMNMILTVLFILTAIILYLTYYLITSYTDWGFLGVLIVFVIIIIIIHLILSFIESHIETYTIHKMISQKKIALAKLKNATFYKNRRDMYFKTHHIYKIDIELYSQDGKVHQYSIYEDIAHDDFSTLPAYVYVTYNNNDKTIGIVPTFILFMTPVVKDIVKVYEEQYKPYYVEALKKQGLTLRAFKKKL